jgi:hypothetical protein
VSCEDAVSLVEQAHGPCKINRCHVDGFVCSADAAGTQQVAVSCAAAQDHDRRMSWTWFGGY